MLHKCDYTVVHWMAHMPYKHSATHSVMKRTQWQAHKMSLSECYIRARFDQDYTRRRSVEQIIAACRPDGAATACMLQQGPQHRNLPDNKSSKCARTEKAALDTPTHISVINRHHLRFHSQHKHIRSHISYNTRTELAKYAEPRYLQWNAEPRVSLSHYLLQNPSWSLTSSLCCAPLQREQHKE